MAANAIAAPAAREFRNPILRGYHADPTICRVGDDYYLATSSSEYFPGVPIYHSRDLVNWTLIGHALHRPEQVAFAGIENSKGVFAPTLRYHDGTFYLISTLVGAPTRSGNFIVTARDPRGPWSAPRWLDEAPGIDPSLFFDEDGRVYYCGNRRPEKMIDGSHRLVWVQEIDVRTGKFTGPRTEFDPAPLYASQAIGPVGWLEAPHIYKRHGWYYLLVSHGGTWLDHAVSFWRSRSPLGPWEMSPANPALTHRGERPPGITSTGHVDLVETPSGEWWAVLLAIRGETGKSVMGRETFLSPVDWSGEWPVFNAQRLPGRVELTMPAPKDAVPQTDAADVVDEFASDTLALGWISIRGDTSAFARVEAKAGKLRLDARPAELTEKTGEPSVLLRRVPEENCRVATVLEFAPPASGPRAGLTILRAVDAVWSVAVERVDGERVASARRGNKVLGRVRLPEEGAVELAIELRERRLTFFAGAAGAVPLPIAGDEAEALATSSAGRFTGAMAGIFATAREAMAAQFDRFELRAGERP